MATTWIKMGTDLQTHPKVVRMASALKADGCPDRLRVVGALHAVWCLFDTHSEDGILAGYTPEIVDGLIGFVGFASAMIDVGWAEFDGQAFVLPGFEVHNGQSAKRRAQDSDRKKTVRKTSASEADKMRTREEKRREEKEQKIDAPDGAASVPPQKSKSGTTLQTYLDACKADGVDAIPEDDAVFAYAAGVGLPREYVALAWAWFKGQYGAGGTGRAKRYRDWRATFRNCVRGGWPKFWAIDQSGAYYLTTAGKQAEREAAHAG